MRKAARRAVETLESLDFRLDHEDRKLRTDRWVYTHANAPDQRLIVNYNTSDERAAGIVRDARQIVGLATNGAGERRPKTTQRQKAERAAERKAREAAHRLADARAAEIEAQKAKAAAQSRFRELDSLLRGRDTSGPVAPIQADAMLTAEQVADTLGVPDRAVLRAIDSGRLTAYRCGEQTKVKGADVRAWAAAWRGSEKSA
jgi:excisionase family DNA binding protein